MATVQGRDFPDHLLYDLDNQIWYQPLGDGTLRAGFTSWAAGMMGDVLVFTPTRVGRDFDRGRSFAIVEGGKWVGSARSAFDGTVVAHNELLLRKPELLNEDAYGLGWMLIVRPLGEQWKEALINGTEMASTFEGWLETGKYRGG